MPRRPLGDIEVGDTVKHGGKDRFGVRELKDTEKYGVVATCVDLGRKQFQWFPVSELTLLKKGASPPPTKDAAARPVKVTRKRGR